MGKRWRRGGEGGNSEIKCMHQLLKLLKSREIAEQCYYF